MSVQKDTGQQNEINNTQTNNIINTYILSEKDFYPPKDTRKFHSEVLDIDGGDNYYEYAKWFYENYEDDLFDN